MFKITAVALGVAGVLGDARAEDEPRHYSKGFVRQPRNAVVPVAAITDTMRAAAPDVWDWTTKGATSPVKDQGACGSCWAFSATEGIESAVFMQHGTMPILSTQQIISCDTTDVGCNGGDLPSAFDYVQSDGGIDSDSSYPDISHGDPWKHECKDHHHVAKVTGYKYAVPACEGGSCGSQDEDGLKAALYAYGPLSVCVNAQSWNVYDGGVVASGSCSGAFSQLDHCVQLVGYDTTASTPYWIVKNSWGSSWGEGGHIWLPIGENSCGIADEAMYVQAEMLPFTTTPAPLTARCCQDSGCVDPATCFPADSFCTRSGAETCVANCGGTWCATGPTTPAPSMWCCQDSGCAVNTCFGDDQHCTSVGPDGCAHDCGGTWCPRTTLV